MLQDFAPQRLVSEATSNDAALASPATQADNPIDKVTDQVWMSQRNMYNTKHS